MQNMITAPVRRQHIHKCFYEYNFTNFTSAFGYYLHTHTYTDEGIQFGNIYV